MHTPCMRVHVRLLVSMCRLLNLRPLFGNYILNEKIWFCALLAFRALCSWSRIFGWLIWNVLVFFGVISMLFVCLLLFLFFFSSAANVVGYPNYSTCVCVRVCMNVPPVNSNLSNQKHFRKYLCHLNATVNRFELTINDHTPFYYLFKNCAVQFFSPTPLPSPPF